jgi:2-polyprenyl-6-methoxyphenol hydroxylase-like FAD-dependent oxidoreductase
MARSCPMVVALRPALHGALLDAVGMDAIATNHEASGFDLSHGRVVLKTKAGNEEGDLLIGADGVASAIRRQLHPVEPPPRPCGIVAVRGAVHGAQHHLGGLSAIVYMDRGVESVIARASDTGIYWFVSQAERLIPAGMRDPKDIVAFVAPKFDATFRAIASATADMRCDELVDRDPIRSWGQGVVTLLGDAAHPLLPHTGQGAAQAMVDAVTLGRLLAGHNAIEPALRAYEKERRAGTSALLAQGRRTARIMRMTNPVLCSMREAVLRMAPVNALARFYVRVNRRAGTE